MTRQGSSKYASIHVLQRLNQFTEILKRAFSFLLSLNGAIKNRTLLNGSIETE